VLRLDFADGLDAAGVNAADAQHLVLAHRPPDDLLSQEWALTEDDIVEHNIGLGDDVVTLGRFIGGSRRRAELTHSTLRVYFADACFAPRRSRDLGGGIPHANALDIGLQRIGRSPPDPSEKLEGK
jgi:hypothetical protein